MELDRSTRHRAAVTRLIEARKKSDPGFGYTALAKEIRVQKIYISREAALMLHEALYLLGYDRGEGTSQRVRKLTADILSINPSLLEMLR